MSTRTRRQFLRDLGLSAAALPFVTGLPSLGATPSGGRQRLVILFTPNGIVPANFWPDEIGPGFKLKRILEPLAPWKERLLLLKGVANKVRGDGDSHMRGMSCALTGTELYPGNIQGGSHTPAGWSKGISIDQELKNFLQSQPGTRTRHGSLELGVAVPNRADPWTRWSYAGPNQPVAPISDPYQLFEKLYGQSKDRETLGSVLDDLREDLGRVAKEAGAEDRALLENHLGFVRDMERELQENRKQPAGKQPPQLESGVPMENDSIPRVSRMQIDLLVNAFANDFARIATLQYTNSVGQAKMRWLGIEEGHHSLSHDPDLNSVSVEKLTKINVWFAEQVALLARKLAETPEPGGSGSMLDHTTIVWTNELGRGNSHTLEDIPYVLLGGGLGFKTGQSLKLGGAAHNRLWLAVAHAFGHPLKSFGNPALCEDGPLLLS